jgi:hypothetical protein
MPVLTKRASHFVVLLALLLPLIASAGDSPEAVIRVRQLPRSEFDVEKRGAVSVAYEMIVRNPSQQAITLRQVTMKTAGRSPYTLEDEAVSFSERIEAGAEATVTFSLWAHKRSGRRAGRETVWVRGTARFETGGGTFVRKFADSFREPD